MQVSEAGSVATGIGGVIGTLAQELRIYFLES